MSLQSNDFVKQMSENRSNEFRLANVSEVLNGETYLTFYGEDTQSEKPYKILNNYNPVVGDTVCVVRINESWLVLGKVTNQYDNQRDASYYLENAYSGSAMRIELIYYSDTDFDHALRPSHDNLVDVGKSTNKYRNIYASNGVIQTSDLREKEEIKLLDESHLKLFRKLLPKSYKFIEGTSGRRHVGFVSQDVEEALKECNMTDMDFAGFIKSPVYEVVDGKETKNVIDHIYGLRYDEFVGILAFALQDVISFVEKLGYGQEKVQGEK